MTKVTFNDDDDHLWGGLLPIRMKELWKEMEEEQRKRMKEFDKDMAEIRKQRQQEELEKHPDLMALAGFLGFFLFLFWLLLSLYMGGAFR